MYITSWYIDIYQEKEKEKEQKSMVLHYSQTPERGGRPACGKSDTGKTVLFITNNIVKVTCKQCLKTPIARRAISLANQTTDQEGENARNFAKKENAAKNDEVEFATNFVEIENFATKVAGAGGG